MQRSIASQSDAELGGTLSVLVRQKRDHARLDLLLDELSHTRGDAGRQTLRKIARLVFSHAFAEEAVLWPAIRRSLPDGEDLTSRVEREHQEINELARQVGLTMAGQFERTAVSDRLVALLREDVRDEEDLLLPRLQQALSTAQLRRLGVEWELVRRSAPTRPHPHVARRPPGNLFAAVPLTMLDRSRDALDQAVGGAGARTGPALRSVARALGAFSERVERARPMRAGEHASTRTQPEGEHMNKRERRKRQLAAAAAKGAAAGLVGVAAMTASEKLEQSVTRRPDSFVPGRALLTLLGRRPDDRVQPVPWNHAMHWATGACLGALRGVWAVTGMRGRRADLAHTVVRLAFDQTVENATGVGAPPHTWPRPEQLVDVGHKAVYSLATGVVADRWLPPVLEVRRGTTSH